MQELPLNVQLQHSNYLQVKMHYHYPSLAANTLANYGNTGGASTAFRPYNLPFRTGADEISYPYNPEKPEFLGQFPLGFKCCLRCGRTDHFTRNDYHINHVGVKKILDTFYKELRTHRPKFKVQEKARLCGI